MDMLPDVQKEPEILISCSLCVGVGLVVAVTRVFVKVTLIHNFGLDDYFMVAATVMLLAEYACVVASVIYGAGRHVQYIDLDDFVTGLHYNFATQPLSITALFLTKVSVDLFLLRLTTSKRHRMVIWGVTTFTALAWLANFFTCIFQCTPIQKIWDFQTDGSCIPAKNLLLASYFNSAVGVTADVLFALLPIPLVWRVQMRRRLKAAVSAILSLGILVAVCGVMKMVHLSTFGQYGDFLFDSTYITIWANVEICTAIVAASAPPLKRLFKGIFDSTILHKSNSRYVIGVTQDQFGGRAAYSQSAKKSIVPLATVSHVTADYTWRTESQEAIVRPDPEHSISKTFSVSVR